MRSRIVIMALSAALMVGALSTIGTVSAFGTVPDSTNFQGILKNSAGNPVPNGSYSVTFQICSTATGGTALWSETQSVTTTGGQFACMLGKITPIPDSVLVNPNRFLGIQVSPDPEMTPRIPLSSVFFSRRVGTLDGAAGGGVLSDVYMVECLAPAAEGGDQPTPMCQSTTCTPQTQCTFPKIWRVGDLTWNPTTHTCGRLCVTNGYEPYIQLDGGSGNIRACGKATLGPGHVNDGDFGFVAGCNNTISADGDLATVSGGKSNTADGYGSTVGGGYENTIKETGDYATVSGGDGNTAEGVGSTVGGGHADIANGHYSSILGGYGNVIGTSRPPDNDDGRLASIGGGYLNEAHGRVTTIGGGQGNSVDGYFSTVPGGYGNSAAGNGSFAAGRQAITTSNAIGSFVWADYTAAPFTSDSPGQFLIRAAGGVGINTNTPLAALHVEGTTYLKGVATLHDGDDPGGLPIRLQSGAWGGARILGTQGNTPERPAIGFFSTNGVDDGGGVGNGIYRPSAHVMAFATQSTERMRIGPGPTVGIGTGATGTDYTRLQVNGAISTAVSTVIGSVTLTQDASVVLASGAGTTVTLPSASSCKGRQVTVKRISAAGPVNVQAAGGDSIDGPPIPAPYPLAAQYDFVVLVSDGVNHWYIVGK